MHELSIASGLVEKVLEFANSRGIGKVVQVRLAIGELTRIEADQLRFCYEAIVASTPLKGSVLEIEPVRAEVSCPHCAYRGAAKYWDEALLQPVPTLECPACGKAAEAAQGHECAIKTIKYAT